MKISREQLRRLIIEQLDSAVSDRDNSSSKIKSGSVSIGWKIITPFGVDLPGKIFDIPVIAHAFIRMERYGEIPSWWPTTNSIITLSGFSEFYDKNWKKMLNIKRSSWGMAYPTLKWGKLQKKIDWGPDLPGNESGLRKISIPSSLSVDEVQKRILDAFQLYGENDHYDPMATTGRNSNSLVFSVLKSALGDKFKLATDKAVLPGVNFPGWGLKVSGL